MNYVMTQKENMRLAVKKYLYSVSELKSHIKENLLYIVLIDQVPRRQLGNAVVALKKADYLMNLASFGVFGNVRGEVPTYIMKGWWADLEKEAPDLVESFKHYKKNPARVKELSLTSSRRRYSKRMQNACGMSIALAETSYEMLRR